MKVLVADKEKQSVLSIQALFFFMIIAVVGTTFSVAVSSIAMSVAIVLAIYHLYISKKIEFPRTPLDLFFALYLIAEFLASVFSIERTASFFNMKRIFLISFVYFALLAIDTERKLITVFGLLVGITALLSVIEIFFAAPMRGHFFRTSMFQHYMTEGGMKMFILLMALPFLIHPSTPKVLKMFAALTSVALFIGLILTQTRSSWLGFIAGVLTMGIVKNKKIILVLFVLIILFVLFAPLDFRTRAASIFDPNMKSNLTRIHMITTGWKMFLDRPLFGFGDIDLKKYYVTYIVPIDDAEGGHLHNNFMTLLVTIGAVGFLATFALFVKIFLLELESVRQTSDHWLFGSISIGCFAAYVGFHINGLFEWNFGDHEIAVLLWFTVGLALVSQRLHHQLTQQPV